jgi:hypothetical protein
MNELTNSICVTICIVVFIISITVLGKGCHTEIRQRDLAIIPICLEKGHSPVECRQL